MGLVAIKPKNYFLAAYHLLLYQRFLEKRRLGVTTQQRTIKASATGLLAR
jgi:hypothetical protein